MSFISFPQENPLSFFTTYFDPRGFILHGFAFFILALLFYLAEFVERVSWIILYISIYSIILEVSQILIPYRSFNPFDIAANLMGIILFYTLVICLGKSVKK